MCVFRETHFNCTPFKIHWSHLNRRIKPLGDFRVRLRHRVGIDLIFMAPYSAPGARFQSFRVRFRRRFGTTVTRRTQCDDISHVASLSATFCASCSAFTHATLPSAVCGAQKSLHFTLKNGLNCLLFNSRPNCALLLCNRHLSSRFIRQLTVLRFSVVYDYTNVVATLFFGGKIGSNFTECTRYDAYTLGNGD